MSTSPQFEDAADAVATRTPTELIVKFIIVHIVSAANYAYLCKLQQKNLNGLRGLTRLLFFVFIPPFAYVEAAFNILQATLNYVRDEVDDEDTDVLFFLSAAMGSHAVQSKSDDEGVKGSDQGNNISLLRLSCAMCERTRAPIEWAWIGKVVLSTTTLCQGIGTIIVWVQRIVFGGDYGVDDRVGAMGVAAVFLSVQCLVILLLRSRWTVTRSTTPHAYKGQEANDYLRIFPALVSLCVQDLARRRNWVGYVRILHNPTVFLLYLIQRTHDWSRWFPEWPFLVMCIFFIMMRKEIMQTAPVTVLAKLVTRYVKTRVLSRLQKLLRVFLVTVILSDVLIRVVEDIIEVKLSPDEHPYISEFWLQTSLSETIPVL